MGLLLYDLALADDGVRPSPYCWIVKFALLHKGLEFETSPLRFAEKENYPDPDYGKLPILKDGDELICDSPNIIAHLEKNYTGKPLVASEGERAAADFYSAWLAADVYPTLRPIMFLRILAVAHEDDKAYFRKSREALFGKPLEKLSVTPGLREKTEAALKLLSAPLTRHRFLGGDEPNLCDYTVFSLFMWQRSITADALYEAPQPVDAWRERMLDLYDGYGRKAKTAG